ncbi:hypothetical protein NLX83_24180 [Allokutzneria sp. A3M-2-11 16]|uniref:2-oxoglutarate and iron-dependent oxygenase domain-containing protein n=1 Tax=Allokutzneria sp. A3M-2-11 16 TaxID=2962043 RepID=UPI0020B89027|nr:2-oxoglutarate and iron-dependent oxygenase domain-containing protein [Allokutzneria sp. A3M-2-11 16]MCP3802371.1 hypothetical protein [Allokutzneria sp. A3M-2-11 16]
MDVIDISSRNSAQGRDELAGAIGTACGTSGFFVIVGHGVPQELVDRMYTVTNAFFGLPAEEKALVAHRPGTSGFRRSGGTTALSLDRQTPPDLCESFGAHTDFGALTVLYQEDDLGGLQVLQGPDEWCDVQAIPGSFVVNIGDLMALWTGGRWVSTMRRVINPERGDTSSRLSIPYFYQPNHDTRVDDVIAGEWMATKTRKLFAPPV